MELVHVYNEFQVKTEEVNDLGLKGLTVTRQSQVIVKLGY